MVILQQPDILSLSGNIKEFRISTADPISFALRQGAIEIIAQSYTPGKDGIVIINLRDIVHSRLSFTLQESALIYEQPSLAAIFTAVISGTEVTFRVIRSGVDRLADTATNFLTQNFLTWQPSTKAVTYYSPEFLTYYAVAACTAQLRAYFTDTSGSVTSQQDITLSAFDAGKAYTIPLQYASVAEKLGNKLPAYYDVWVESPSASRLTYIQRYYASDMLSEQEQWVLFENSLGGIDTFRAYGSTDFTADHTHNIAEIDEVSSEYRVDTARKFQKNTGHLTDKERRWLLDFFPSQSKYIYAGTYLRRIVVAESNVTYTDRELPSAYTFTYKYADARPLLNLPRTDVPSGALNITVPSVGSFTVPPRLVEFPRLPLTEGALFPIQNPYSEEWNTTTAGSLGDFIAERLSQNYGGTGGVGHQHNNIDLLQLLTYATEYLLVAGKKIKAGYADKAGSIDGLEKLFLSRVEPDFTTHLLKFLAGAEFGTFMPGMIGGSGASIDSLGNLEAESGTFRSSLRVLELIYNRISVTDGKNIWSAGGTIERIEQQGDNAYLCWIRKQFDTDFVKFKADDILMGNFNQTGGFYNSYMRVINVDTSANTIVVVVGADISVPSGTNYPPCELMVLARIGNYTDKSRQSSIYLDSESLQFCMLDGVDSYIISPFCKKGFIGKVDGPAELGLPADAPIQPGDMVGFFDKLFAKNFFTVDRKGQIIKKEIDRGAWSSTPIDDLGEPWPYEMTDTEVDCCWHLNCRWKCIVPVATTGIAPSSESSEWLLVTGDTKLSMSIQSTDGWTFRPTQVDTTLVATVNRGMEDITSTILASDWEWKRDSKHPLSDTAWNAAHAATTSQLSITFDDMGPNWLVARKVIFTCIAYIRIGSKVETVYKSKPIRL